jgi:hypothetical protein
LHFLVVRFPVSLLREQCKEWSQEPRPAYETESRVFYETDLQVVAERLLDLFQHKKPEGDLPPIIEIIKGFDLTLPGRVFYRQEIESLEKIESVGDWDPGVWEASELPHDRRTVLLMRHRYQAQQWEPLIRKELGLRVKVETIETGSARGEQADVAPKPPVSIAPDQPSPEPHLHKDTDKQAGAVAGGIGTDEKSGGSKETQPVKPEELQMPAEDLRVSGLVLLMLLAQAYYKMLECTISTASWCSALDLELNQSYLWTVTSLSNLLKNHADLKDFPVKFEPLFPDLYPSTIRDCDWDDMVAPEAERFLSTVQQYVLAKGMHELEKGSSGWTFIEMYRPSVNTAIEQAIAYDKRMRQYAKKAFGGIPAGDSLKDGDIGADGATTAGGDNKAGSDVQAGPVQAQKASAESGQVGQGEEPAQSGPNAPSVGTVPNMPADHGCDPKTDRSAMPSYFLTARFPWTVVQGQHEDRFKDAYEKYRHVFYQTDSEIVAKTLVKMLLRGLSAAARGDPAATLTEMIKVAGKDGELLPFAVLEVVNGAALPVAQRVANRKAVEFLERRSRGDVDSAAPLDFGSASDRRTLLLWQHYDRARELEPAVREELRVAALDELNSKPRAEAILTENTMKRLDSLHADGLNRAEVLRCISIFRRARWEFEDSLQWVRDLSDDAGGGDVDAKGHRAATRDYCSTRNVNAGRQAAETFPVIMRQAEIFGFDVAGLRAAIVRNPWGPEVLRDVEHLVNQIEERLAGDSPATGRGAGGVAVNTADGGIAVNTQDHGVAVNTAPGGKAVSAGNYGVAVSTGDGTTDTPEVYKWAKQAEVIKATNQVLGPGELNKGVLCKSIHNQDIKSNDKSGRASRVNTDSFLVWIQRREKLQNDEVLQIRNAIIGEISNRKPSRN